MENRVKRFTKLFPWHHGLIGDLLFYVAIDTLFLTVVKNFSAAEIVSLTSLSQIVCIGLQFPILFVIKKIGNTASVRTGGVLILLSSILITFGPSYIAVLLGRILHDAAVIFKSASIVMLENNLDLVNNRRDFVRLRTKANTVYAVITMIISFVASFMFNLNNYFPMICCIVACFLGFVLTLFMKDYSAYDKISRKTEEKKKIKISFSSTVVMIVVVYAIFYTIVNNGQNEGKLFIQEQLMLDFNVEVTALVIGVVVSISRIVRVFSNIVFAKLYEKYDSKMGVALPILLAISIALLFFGSLLPSVYAKIPVMTVGYIIILFSRDPFNIYIQDILFQSTPKEQHQMLLTILTLSIKIAGAAFGLVFSAILLGYPLVVVIAIMLVIAIIEIVLSMILYSAVMRGKENLTSSDI